MNLRDKPFRLSKAEDRVARLLLLGARPVDIANQLGRGITTTRSQLRAIFWKADVKTQAAFIRKVAMLDGWDCSPYA